MSWSALVLLGLYHGLNPGMGWLLAVALGMQQQDGRAVWWALWPIAVGHAVAIGAVVSLFGAARFALPLGAVKIGVAALLVGLGLYRLFRSGHPRFGGMRVGFRHLATWSFLMASAHGAGLMVLPFVFGMGVDPARHAHGHGAASPALQVLAVLVHTGAYLLVTGLIAWVVYAKIGLRFLRKGWLNFDLVWAIALIATGVFVLVL